MVGCDEEVIYTFIDRRHGDMTTFTFGSYSLSTVLVDIFAMSILFYFYSSSALRF